MNRFSKFAASALALSLVPAMLMGCGKKETAASSDLDYIKQKGTLVVGITDFAPMDYQDADGSWIGFDADLAKPLPSLSAWRFSSRPSSGTTRSWSWTARPSTSSGTA